VRTAFTVDGVLTDQGVVSGVKGRLGDGPSVTERATLTVGADGHQSVVARAVQAPVYHDRGVLACCYYTYFADLPLRGFEMYGRGRRAIGLMPTNDGLGAHSCPGRVRSSRLPRGHRRQLLGTCDLVRSSVGAGARGGGPSSSTAANLQLLPRPTARVGARRGRRMRARRDGAGHRRRVQGCELLVEAIVSATSRAEQRNKAAMPMFELTTDLASYRPPEPRKVGVLRAGRQPGADRLLGVLAGCRDSDFFGP
jgi:hypothetical protein